jgi:predicted nucleic acid-binding protein
LTAPPFLDTNIILRHLLGDHPQQSPRATALLQKVESGEVSVTTAESVLFETIFTMQRTYRVAKDDVRRFVRQLLAMRGLEMRGKARIAEALDLFIELNLSFLDAYHVVLMRNARVTQMYSYDRGLDRVPWVTRIEP